MKVTDDGFVLLVAEMCHEMNAVYCRSLGDGSQPLWSDAPEWQKDSAISGVKGRMADRDGPVSRSHECWSAQKITDGWIYGPIKDPDAKTHPCLVPFDQLPVEQQRKDEIFCGIVDLLVDVFSSMPST